MGKSSMYRKSLAVVYSVILILLCFCSPALIAGRRVQESGESPSLADRKVAFTVDDLEPVQLNGEDPVPKTPELRFERKIDLKEPNGEHIQNIELLTVANNTFYMFDFESKSVQLFDHNGMYLSAISHPGFKEECTPFVIASYSQPLQKVVAAVPGQGLYIFHDAGKIDQILNFPEVDHLGQSILGVTPSANGDLLAITLYVRGPYLALIRDFSLLRQFYKDRTPTISARADFRTNFWPLVFVDSDQEGSIYTCERVDYEIRKYGPNGNYLGDFVIMDDSSYVPPPNSLDFERYVTDKEFKDEWNNSWTQVDAIGVLNNEYLVVCLATHSQQGYSLHFYSLNGAACDHPVLWPMRLMCIDEDSRMYFLEKTETEQHLSVWSIGQ